MTPMDARLRDALAGDRFALVGAGQLGEMAIRLWPETVAKPEFLLDSHRTGTLSGVQIRDLKTHAPVPGVTYLLSAFRVTAPFAKEVLATLGHADLITVYDFFNQQIPDVFSNGWRRLTPSEITQDHIRSMRSVFADAESVQTYDAAAAWRYGRDLRDDYPLRPDHTKYDLSQYGRAGTRYDYIYDCGAYNLSLLDSLKKAGISAAHIIAFEPDPQSIALCQAQADAWGETMHAAVRIDPRALSDGAGLKPFVANGLMSARLVGPDALDRAEVIACQTCALGDVHAEMFGDACSPATRMLIKLHVEGEEVPALHGAMPLLEAYQSDLLISLSHDEASFLEVPAMLGALGRHDLFLRSYSLFGEGLILFARYRG